MAQCGCPKDELNTNMAYYQWQCSGEMISKMKKNAGLIWICFQARSIDSLGSPRKDEGRSNVPLITTSLSVPGISSRMGAGDDGTVSYITSSPTSQSCE